MTGMRWTQEARQYCPHGISGNGPFIRWMAKHLGDGLLVDCGANVGAVCISTLLQAEPGARAVAFEPQTRAADALEALAEKNGVDVELHRTAVNSYVGKGEIKYPVEKSISGWGTLADEPDFMQAANRRAEPFRVKTCKVTTLDAWWEEAGRPDVQVVKVDCQGAEPDILDGGAELFATVPFLFIEKHAGTLNEHGHSVECLLEKLAALGYACEPANRSNLYCRKDGQ